MDHAKKEKKDMSIHTLIQRVQEDIEIHDPLRIRTSWFSYVLAGLFFLIAVILTMIPYVNILIPPAIGFSFAIIGSIMILRISVKHVVLGVLSLVGISLIFNIFGREDIIEVLGTIMYILLWYIGCVYFFKERTV